MRQEPTVSTLPCKVVLNCAAARGIEAQMLCRDTGLDPRLLANPDSRVPVSVYYTLLERLALLTEDPHIGLQIPAHAQAEAYGLLGFLFMRSTSVGQAFDRMFRYQRLISDPVLSMTLREDTAVVTYELWGPSRPAHAHVADNFAAETVLAFEMLQGPSDRRTFELHLTRPATDPAPYVQHLGICPHFSAPRVELRFDAALLDLPVASADPALAQMLEHQAQIMLSLLPARPSGGESETLWVREFVLGLLPNGVPKIEQVAKRLGQSPRSLQRHLRSERSSLKLVIDDLRRELGQVQLRRGVPMAEVALLLGFSEVSAFHRAFKRWTGQSPGSWRDAAIGRDPSTNATGR